MEEVNDKLKNLILYVLSDSNYREGGIKKLNKLLYFIDFYFFRDHEQLISGAQYAKAPMGPILEGYEQIFKRLEDEGAVRIIKDGRTVLQPLQKYDLGAFSAVELDHIRKVLERYGNLGPSELESISHEQQPWVLTEKDGDIIDPDLALLMANTDSDDERVIGDAKLKKELIELANSV